jgi:integrin beta 2
MFLKILALSFVLENLYWIESGLDQIEVAKMNGSYRRTLISGNMQSPRALALDPSDALIFWTDWDSNGKPRIESCSMDGRPDTRRIVFLVSEYGGAWPNGLALDYLAKRVYWIDARSDSIHTTGYSGEDHREIARGHQFLSHPFSLAVFESQVYWTDWRTSSVVRANKWNGSDIRVVDRTLTKPYGIKVVHPSLQASLAGGPHPCQVNNGGCARLCLLGPNRTRTCACPHVMQLDASDGTSCLEKKVMLLYAAANEVRGVDFDAPHRHLIPPIPTPYAVAPDQLAFLAASRQIVWLDVLGPNMPHIQVIRRAFIGSDDSHVMDIIDTGSSPAARGLSVDPTAETVFYAGSDDLVPDESSILAARLDGTRVVRIRDVNAAVRQVVVVPARGILFWHEVMNNENGTENIMRAWMDGTEAQAVVSLAARGVLEEDQQQQQQQQPAISNLTYSQRTGRLYWLQGAGQLRYFDLASSRLGEMELELVNVTAMTEHNGTLFFAQQLQQQQQQVFVVSEVQLQGETAATVVRNFSHAVLSLAVYDPESQQERSKCNVKNGGCAHLCVPVKEGNSE